MAAYFEPEKHEEIAWLRDVIGESQDQLIDKLEGFLLELGRWFCFEARQKRILIGKKHYFVSRKRGDVEVCRRETG